jgi:hypothetical protein
MFVADNLKVNTSNFTTGKTSLSPDSTEGSPPVAQNVMVIAEPTTSKLPRVDFNHTELCADFNPVTCTVNREPVPVGTWRDLLVNLVEMFMAKGNPNINDLFNKPLRLGSKRPFLLREKLKLKGNSRTRQLTTGDWVFVDLTIASLVDIIGKLCEYCGVNLDNVEITYTPKSSGGFAHKNYKREDSINFGERHPGLPGNNAVVPPSIIAVLSEDYSGGFRFDATALRLLPNKVGVEIDENMQSTLKQQMFRRNDDVYFLLDVVANAETRKDIVSFAGALLDEYGCFEIPELYVLYADRLNPKCIGGAEDFENFYERISRRDVRCVAAPQIGNRIARYINGNVWEIFSAIAQKIIAITNDEFGGVISEEDLHQKFCAFSTDLLAKIIRNCIGDEILRVEINGVTCYQTLDALGLPDGFSDMLSDTLCRLDDLGLTPNEEILHTALSLALDVNFKVEYNIPDQAVYRRLIAACYKADPPREWKGSVFGKVPG